MSLDVSSDGKSILFDLIGDLYTVPIVGGEAALLMGGRDGDPMPRYSRMEGRSLSLAIATEC